MKRSPSTQLALELDIAQTTKHFASLRHDAGGSSGADVTKEHGVHYTPPELAGFLARRLLAHASGTQGQLSVLDPAAGEGELLAATAEAAKGRFKSLALIGVDRDEVAAARARARLAGSTTDPADIRVGDFLAGAAGLDDRQFDAIISNPPYVRTQVLGATAARDLAERFDLTGRIDLYQAFVRAITELLRPGGVLGLLCTNRFLTTQAGTTLRTLLTHEYDLCEIYDLGDTKLFEAAVLPAIVIARRLRGGGQTLCHFTRVYERSEATDAAAQYPSVVVALDDRASGLIDVREHVYEVEHGELARGATTADPWRLTHEAREQWLATVARHTELTFGQVAPIRVGIKTTADGVFIREDWNDLEEEVRPESQLVHPLLTHHVAARWRASETERSVLYPHVSADGKRATINLDEFPRAAAYLQLHRARLEGRSYVAEAGRQWFEIWVPQQPSDWSKRKVVFPDISELPQFFLDTSGAVVNGDCYWMTLGEDVPAELVSLLLAVGNSSFAVEFYDAVCGNRLYAGRRRFITQYVKRFPLPRLDSEERTGIHQLVERLCDLERGDPQGLTLEAELDALVWRAFGLREEVAR